MGFGDFHPLNDAARGLVFPYSVGGIIILGLMVSSIRKFAREISHDNIVKPAAEKRRARTFDRSVTTTVELERRVADEKATSRRLMSTSQVPANVRHPSRRRKFKSGMKLMRRVGSRNQKLVLLQEEKDRFNAMRSIQRSTSNFKKYSALTMSVIACKSNFIQGHYRRNLSKGTAYSLPV